LGPAPRRAPRDLTARAFRSLALAPCAGSPAPLPAWYVLIAQDRPAVDRCTCQADGRWLLEADTDPAAPIRFESIGCTLTLSEVYDKVEFEA